ncbi:MAG: hypothetical protein GWN11_04080 [Candidatus Dadabacteria bacterium]|nr:hypothetical protein [Candidatus Dadabacteria bacterium]
MEQSTQSIEPEGMFSGLNFKAIIVGVLADIVSTLIFGMILTTVLLVKQYGADIPEDGIDNILKSNSNLYLYLLLGLTCTVLGGFVGGRMAGAFEIRHGGWVGTASLITGVILEMLSNQEQVYPDWYMYISFAGIIPAGVLGGYVSVIFKKVNENT